MDRYRDALGVRRMVPQELARMGAGKSAKTPATGEKK